MMKISILTQPIQGNYGGLLQAFALQQYLTSLGHEVETLDYQGNPDALLLRAKKLLRYLVRLAVGQIRSIPTKSSQIKIQRQLMLFRNQHMRMSPKIIDENSLKNYYLKEHFDAVIVGSDQVWRPKYSPCLRNFYLDFLDSVVSKAKRISYASSFGVDAWEYTPEQTEQCKKLIQKFDALSVREKSAQILCQKYFDVNPELMLDPTMLLSTDKYRELFKQEIQLGNRGKVLTYFLDFQQNKLRQACFVAEVLKTETFSVRPNLNISDVPFYRIEECALPPVEEWLQSFDEAEFVITDSFHGCVFSIIFNKPFIAIGNAKRGVSRFESLLELFNLRERLVYPDEQIDKNLISNKINWEEINHTRQTQSELARSFLREGLGERV